MKLRLHQMRALVAAVEHGGIRAAARHLHVTQAALTKALRELEEDAGVPLLVRSSLGVRLTPAGERLHARARLVTRQLELAASELRQDGADGSGSVAVALTPFVTLLYLGPAFRAFRARYPCLSVETTEGLVSRVLPRLRDGSLDLALVADAGDLVGSEFTDELLLSVPQHVVVRAGHPVLADLSLAALSALEWQLTGPRDGLKSARLSAMFERAGAQPPARTLMCDALTGLSLLRQTDVAGILPAPLLATPEARDLVALPSGWLDPGPLSLRLLTRPDVPLSAPAAYFAQCLRHALTARLG